MFSPFGVSVALASLSLLSARPLSFLILMLLMLHRGIRPPRASAGHAPASPGHLLHLCLCADWLFTLRTLLRSWAKIPHWLVPLRLLAHRAHGAGLMACKCFRYLILRDHLLAWGEAGSKYGGLEKTLQTQVFLGSRQLMYMRKGGGV